MERRSHPESRKQPCDARTLTLKFLVPGQFPVPLRKFPDTPIKFPVPLFREFVANMLILRINSAEYSAISPRFAKIPCKFPVKQGVRTSDRRDGFARDCLHRQIFSSFQLVRKLRVDIEHCANLVSRGRIANILQTHPQFKSAPSDYTSFPVWRCHRTALKPLEPSGRRLEPLEPQRETIPIRKVLGAGGQVDRYPVQLLQRFEHRAIMLTEQTL